MDVLMRSFSIDDGAFGWTTNYLNGPRLQEAPTAPSSVLQVYFITVLQTEVTQHQLQTKYL